MFGKYKLFNNWIILKWKYNPQTLIKLPDICRAVSPYKSVNKTDWYTEGTIVICIKHDCDLSW